MTSKVKRSRRSAMLVMNATEREARRKIEMSRFSSSLKPPGMGGSRDDEAGRSASGAGVRSG